MKTSSLLAMTVVSLVVLAIPSSYAQLDNESITINTQKSTYGPGDTVNLTGFVNEGTPGLQVAIEVKDAKGNLILIRSVTVDQNGNFNLQFKMPTGEAVGGLDITANAKINGFVITQNKDTTPVPEFPTSGLVLAASLASLLIFCGMVSSRGMSGMKQRVGGGK